MKSLIKIMLFFLSASIVVSAGRNLQPYRLLDSNKEDNFRIEANTKQISSSSSVKSVSLSSTNDSHANTSHINVTTSAIVSTDSASSPAVFEFVKAHNSNNSTNSSNSTMPLNNDTFLEKKSESLFLDITDATEKIQMSICNQRTGISDTLDQIFNQLRMTKDKINASSTINYSKRKLYLKFAKIANMINMSVSELKRVSDLIEILKCAKCENLESLIDKINTVSAIPDTLVGLTSQSMKQVNINMNLAYSQ